MQRVDGFYWPSHRLPARKSLKELSRTLPHPATYARRKFILFALFAVVQLPTMLLELRLGYILKIAFDMVARFAYFRWYE